MSAATILLVEDNPITRKMLRVTLEIEGYDVRDGPDGKTALELATARRPDLVIFDFVLPDMDGLELLAEVRSRLKAPELPAIIITGMVSRVDDLRARSGGSTHLLTKPVVTSQLLEVVRAQLSPALADVGGQRILVVDDEPLNLKLAVFRLERAGYRVETAPGGEAAFEIISRRRPDAILSDVMMPAMDGFSFCRQARRDPALARVPIILVSSEYVDEADRDLARQMGANALVVRTPDLSDALTAIQAGLGGAMRAPPSKSSGPLALLHRDRLQVQLERQTARNETLLRQAAIQATALSIVRGLSEVLAEPREVPQILGDVLVHCLDAAGLSTGLLYITEPGGDHRLQAQFGVPAHRRADAEAVFGHPQLMRRIIESGKPAAFSSEVESGDPEARDFLARLGYPSVLILPFVVLGETFGELVLASESHDLSESSWIGFARSLALQFGQTVALGQSLKRLAASESRYRALMEQANDAILILDSVAKILEVNREAERLLGRPRGEIVGHRYNEFVARDEEAESTRFHRQLLDSGSLRVENRQLLRADGTQVSVEVSTSLVKVGDESVVLTILRDVTERIRSEVEIRQRMELAAFAADVGVALVGDEPIRAVLQRCAEAMLRHLDPAFARIWTLDAAGTTLELQASAGMYTHLDGAHARVPVGKFKIGLIAAEREARLTNDVQSDPRVGDQEWARREGMVAFAGYPLVVGDRLVGVMAMFARHAIPETVFDAMAAVANQIALGIERNRSERRLQESEEQYRLLFDRNPYPMWVFDIESLAFLAVNDAAVRHYGWTREEFLGMRITAIRPPEAIPELMEEIDALRLDVEWRNRPGVWRHRKQDGTEIDVEIITSAITFLGRAARLTLAADVTERTGLQAQLVRSQKMEAVGQLAGGVAHDFNNLLGVITGYSELLIKVLPAESRERKRAEEIKAAADRAATLTRQLLAFSRRQVLQPTVLNLGKVVADVAKMLRRVISEDIQIAIESASGPATVRADASQVEQVIMNLVVNARDAMPSGGRLVIETANVTLDETHVRSAPGARSGDFARLSVADTGHGMDARTVARIFEPFFTTKEEGKGTGLGLATVYGIVQQSGGWIDVHSEPGHGTTFHVFLPRVPVDVEAEASAPVEPAPGGGETILVVEDAEALRLLVRELLESAGYTVLDAEGPEKALALAQSTSGPIHVILTDIVMPRMSGQELAGKLAILYPDARLVLMSGYSERVFGEGGTLPAGALFLQKPFTMDGLLRTIRRALNGS